MATANPSKPARAVATARQSEIDGIRGWAAIVVLLFYLLWELYGEIYPGLRIQILGPLLDGPLAVYVFFVLSGDALSIGFTDARRNGVSPRMVLKRYSRLFGPILFSCLATYLLIKFGWTFNHEAAAILRREDWLGAFLSFKPSLFGMLRFSALKVFTNAPPWTSYNPFLWPMGIELGGSMLIFSLSIIYRDLRRPILLTAGAAIALIYFGSPYGLFLVGVVYGALRSDGVFASFGRWPAWNRGATIVITPLLYVIISLPLPHDKQLGLVLGCAVVAFCLQLDRFTGDYEKPPFGFLGPDFISGLLHAVPGTGQLDFVADHQGPIGAVLGMGSDRDCHVVFRGHSRRCPHRGARSAIFILAR